MSFVNATGYLSSLVSGVDRSKAQNVTQGQHGTTRDTLEIRDWRKDSDAEDTKELFIYRNASGPSDDPDQPFGGSCCSNKAWLYPELPWGAPPSWKEQSGRGQTFLSIWELWTVLCCLYIGGMTPYILAFHVDNDDDRNSKASCMWTGVINFSSTKALGFKEMVFMVDVIIDTTFLIDIIITLHTAIWDVSTIGTPHWILIDDLPTIQRRYIRGFFFLDVFAIIPWHFFDCISEKALGDRLPYAIKLLRILRLIKLLRLYRIRRMIETLNRNFPKSIYIVTLAELMCVMLLTAHWMACAWFYVGYPDGWVVDEGFSGPEEERMLAEDFDFQVNVWVTSVYWAITTMTTIGYGDITATNRNEKILAGFFMTMGCAFFAYVTGRMTTVLTSKSPSVEKFEAVLDDLNEYMDARNYPFSLRFRLRSFYMLKYPTKMIFDEQTILDSFEPSLRKECYLHLYSDFVSNVELFSLCDNQTQKEICYHLQPCYRAVGSEIISPDDPQSALFLVRFGVVEIRHDKQVLMHCNPGDLVGETNLMGLADTRRQMRAVAKTMCELSKLSANDFHKLLVNCPSFMDTVAHACDIHIAKLEAACQSDDASMQLRDWFCVDWRSIGNDIREERRRLMVLAEDREGRLGTLSNLCEMTSPNASGRPPLRTRIQIRLHDMCLSSLLAREDIPLASRGSRNCNGDVIFVVISWAGDPHVRSPVRSETPLLELPDSVERAFQQARVPVILSVDLTLVHDSNDWATLPPLIVSVHRMKRPNTVKILLKGALSRTPSFRPGLSVKAPKGPGSSKMAGFLGSNSPKVLGGDGAVGMVEDEHATEELWTGQISLEDVMQQRARTEPQDDERNKVPTTQKVCLSLEPSTDSPAAHLANLWLNVTCEVHRKLWPASRWFEVLSLISNRHGGYFFKKKRQLFLDAIKSKAGGVLRSGLSISDPPPLRPSNLARIQAIESKAANILTHGKGETIKRNFCAQSSRDTRFSDGEGFHELQARIEETSKQNARVLEKMDRILDSVEAVHKETKALRVRQAKLETLVTRQSKLEQILDAKSETKLEAKFEQLFLENRSRMLQRNSDCIDASQPSSVHRSKLSDLEGTGEVSRSLKDMVTVAAGNALPSVSDVIRIPFDFSRLRMAIPAATEGGGPSTLKDVEKVKSNMNEFSDASESSSQSAFPDINFSVRSPRTAEEAMALHSGFLSSPRTAEEALALRERSQDPDPEEDQAKNVMD